MTLSIAQRLLVDQIVHLQVPYGQLALWSLGQAGFIIKGGKTLACIDPFLSSGPGLTRRIPIVLEPGALSDLDIVFATHEHLDHADPLTLGPMLAASENAVLVTSPQAAAIAQSVGVAEACIITPALGQRHEHAGLAWTALPAAHYSYELDAQGCSRWMGFVIECNGVTIYHSGDTIMFPELTHALQELKQGQPIDLALLPINGRDYMREAVDIVGNLWPHEAVEVARLLGVRTLIGMHNDLFAANRVAPGLLYDAVDRIAPDLCCHTLQAGELYLVVRTRSVGW